MPSLGLDLKKIREETALLWGSVPHKIVFGALLICWFALFHFIGNSTFGHVNDPSLFAWLYHGYNSPFGDDTHGFWIPFIVLGLCYWKREELKKVNKRPWWPGLILVFLALGLHVLGYVVQQQRVSVIGFFVGI